MAAIREGFKSRGMSATEGVIKGYAHALCDLSAYDVHDALAELWRDAETRSMPAPGVIRKHIRSKKATEQARAWLPEPDLSDYDHKFGLEAAKIYKRVQDPEDPMTSDDADRVFAKLAKQLGDRGADVRMRQAVEDAREEFTPKAEERRDVASE